MMWFVYTWLFVGVALCVLMRWNWGAPISNNKYLATILLWPYIIVLGLMGKLS